MKSLLRSLARILAGVLAALVGLVYPFFYFNQERLIFLGASPGESLLHWARARPGVRELRLEMADGVRLHGWLLPVEGDPQAPLLIYFGGNAEDATGVLAARDDLPGAALLLVNYRGYGLSEGRPGQDALLADAVALHDWALRESGLAPNRVFAWGRSLGSGVAVHLAARRHLAGVILTTPYDSLRAVAQHHYPWIPVGLLLRHPFDSLALAPAQQTPLLTLVAANDRIVPPVLAERLTDAWGGPKNLIRFTGVNHNDIEFAAGYWEAIGRFMGGRVKG